MSRERFFKTGTALYFADKEKLNDKINKAWTIRPIINHFNQAFSRAINLTCQQSIDKHMIKFKGQHGIRQNTPLKPIKRGFKLWCRNDFASRYIFQFDIYAGRKKNKEGSLGKNVVTQLSRSLVGMCQVIFDTFFYNNLVNAELKRRLNIFLWPVCQNKKGMPKLSIKIKR